jgi:hypothetical protein
MTRAFDPDLSNLPFREPHTRRAIDDFQECIARAIRNVSRCRAMVDDVPELCDLLELSASLLAEALTVALDVMLRNLFERGVPDLTHLEPETNMPKAVERLLIKHAQAVASQVGQAAVKQAVIDAAMDITRLLGEGGVSRRVGAGLLARAAAHGGVNEAAASVWAFKAFRRCEAGS